MLDIAGGPGPVQRPVSRSVDHERWHPDVPGEDDLLGRALTVLGDHTHTPDDEYFCVWDGWGRPPSLKGMPVVAVPHRRYLMFRGTLTDYADWVSPGTAGLAAEGLPPPAPIWPADRAW